ncbi:tRNA (adenosine(37)-N6)-threonylcarbamoyltransferase complex dimerization subunit type 1 TsaB [Polynucleobacter sp. SHI8]|uniref:tRNA (adenosine(37)-N6)-threonylcarbamoyltransferase complex dimerization subunit type 1 TsaB n=1 Tax=unclassified Polynucleobacter TaxID=2640945 RepID=UPI0024926A15|nr:MULTISPECIES: tRNA (adenosine(37)-N6)-threonylcarbamoyltransferase complex dimerization subunit type 1 TsaB [unclassified Polynucleobacter]BDW11073.1 tRNA (adenosine(37)-N6)-threonylcarbamoyltransferase complex dimerization subunit type 1 TsaB [Polynucleobacter sp. SHI2]BDW13519.1 tRNA (adenosine(37)-N6)-threonylcarbamoyltransferase complex dimerization subunit type 1 TsaB [Polynucleobacter sp. SHI8]
MPILAIDTSTQWCSVAIYFPNKTYLVRHEKVGNTASQVLLPWIQDLMLEANITWNDIRVIAVSQGPGAFTGIRLGLGVAQGLAYAQQKPLIPIPSLDGMIAFALFFSNAKVLQSQTYRVLLDARMQQVYCASYEIDEHHLLNRQQAIQLIDVKDIDFKQQSIDYTYDMQSYEEDGSLQLGMQFIPATPHALGIAYLASLKNGDQIYSPKDCQPLYIRDQVALTIAQRLQDQH